MGPNSNESPGRYLTFKLAREEFALQAQSIRAVMGVQGIRSVPRAPGCVKGVIDLRGKIVPVVDLRVKFGLPEAPYNRRTCIVVVQIQSQGGMLLTGIVVDSVSGVLGTAKIKDKVRVVLDMDSILSAQELQGLRSFLG